MTKPYPDMLATFFGATFNPDWSLDHATSAEAVAEFIAENPRSVLASVADQLEALLSEPESEENLQRIARKDLEAHFDPAWEGLTTRAWMEGILTELRSASNHSGDGQ